MIEYRNGSVVANRIIVAFLKQEQQPLAFIQWENTADGQTSVKDLFDNMNKDLRTALNNEAGDAIKSDSLRCFQMSKVFANFRLVNRG